MLEHCVYVCVLLGTETRVFLTPPSLTDLCLKPPLISPKAIMYVCTLRKIMWQHPSSNWAKLTHLSTMTTLGSTDSKPDLIPNPSSASRVHGVDGEEVNGLTACFIPKYSLCQATCAQNNRCKGHLFPSLQKSQPNAA